MTFGTVTIETATRELARYRAAAAVVADGLRGELAALPHGDVDGWRSPSQRGYAERTVELRHSLLTVLHLVAELDAELGHAASIAGAAA